MATTERLIESFAWSERLMPQVLGIVRAMLPDYYTIRPATVAEDRYRASDLILRDTLHNKNYGMAVRLREHYYLAKYGGQFTIRTTCKMPGEQTELEKMAAGWGHYLFYGFASEQGYSLAQWFIGDLGVWRKWWHGQGMTVANDDPEASQFQAFSLRELPREFVRAASWRDAARRVGVKRENAKAGS